MQGKAVARGKAWLQHMEHRFTEGWQKPGDDSNASRKSILVHNFCANVIGNLIGANFFTGLLIILQADDAFVGLVTILTFGANLLQLFSPYVLERFERRKPMLIALRSLMHVINIVFIGLIPFFPAAQQAKLSLMGISVLLVNLINAFNGPGMSVWHFAHIPPGIRVQYFTSITILNGVGIALFNLLGSFIVDSFKAANMELIGLETLRLIALGLAVLDIMNLLRIKEKDYVKPPKKIRLGDLFIKPWRDKVYLRSVLVVFMWSVVVNMPGAYYMVYLLRELNISYFYINAIAALNVLILMLFTPIWRGIFVRRQWLRPLSWAIFLFAPHYFLLAFVSKGLMFLYPIAVVWSFICLSGINLAFSSVAYINIPKENQTLYIGFYQTANFMAAMTAATIGRTFVTSASGLRFSLLGVQIGEKQLLMMIVGLLVGGVGYGVRRIYKKNLADQVDV